MIKKDVEAFWIFYLNILESNACKSKSDQVQFLKQGASIKVE